MQKITKFLLYTNLFLLQSYLIRFEIFGYKSNLQEILFLSLFLSFFISKIITGKCLKTIKNIENHWILIGFLSLSAISSILIQAESGIYFLRAIKFIGIGVVLTFIFLETLQKDEEKEKGLMILSIGATAFAIFSVLYNLFGINLPYDYRLQGPLDSAVYLGYYLSPFVLYTLISFIEKKKKLYLIPFFLLTISLILTRSMGSIGGVFFTLLVYFLIHFKEKIFSKKRNIIYFSLITLTIITAIFFTKILPAIQTNYGSLNERSEIWKTSLYLLEKPKNLIFGVGINQFQTQYEKNVFKAINNNPLDYIVLQPHNIFLFFIFNWGILGFIFIFHCIYICVERLIKFKTIPSVQKIYIFILIYFFIHGMIDTPWMKNDTLFLLILFMEMALLNNKKAKTTTQNV